MSEVDENPTRQVVPQPAWPCRRCEHPHSEHYGENKACTVEFGAGGRVPTTALGGTCDCKAYVFDPANAPLGALEPEPELLDGPAMYADGLRHLRVAYQASSPGLYRSVAVEREALARASVYFAGAQAAVLGRLAIDNGTGDLEERRWLAALANEELPTELPPTVVSKRKG